jgi:hypothetical protein
LDERVIPCRIPRPTAERAKASCDEEADWVDCFTEPRETGSIRVGGGKTLAGFTMGCSGGLCFLNLDFSSSLEDMVAPDLRYT